MLLRIGIKNIYNFMEFCVICEIRSCILVHVRPVGGKRSQGPRSIAIRLQQTRSKVSHPNQLQRPLNQWRTKSWASWAMNKTMSLIQITSLVQWLQLVGAERVWWSPKGRESWLKIVSHLHDPREAPPAPGTMSKEDYQHYSVLSFLKAVAMLAVMHPERTQKSFMDVSF